MIPSRKLLWEQTFPLLQLRGEGTKAFLHGQTSADFLGEIRSFFVHSCWLDTAGRVRALLEILLTDEGAEVLVLGGDANDLIEGFEKAIFPMDKVWLEPPEVKIRVQLLASGQLSRFENIAWRLPDQQLSKDFDSGQIATPNECERWRMEHGLSIGPDEINGKNNPFELGLGNIVSINKGCYLGQETIAKVIKAGNVRQQLRFWSADSPLIPGQVLARAGSDSLVRRNVGVITSAIKDKERGCSFGFAMLKSSALAEKEFYLDESLSRLNIKTPFGFAGVPNGS